MDNQKPQDEEEAKEELKEDSKIENLGWGVVGVAAIICGTYWFFLRGLDISTQDPAPWGAMGDYFGGILNPTIAGCALYVLIKSFKVQKQELKEARAELTKAINAQKLQAELTEKQLEQVDRQNFENLFFKLLSNYHNSLNYHGANRLKSRPDKNCRVCEIYIENYISYILNMDGYWSNYKSYEYYAMSFLIIIDTIENTKISDDDKKKYQNILLSSIDIEEKFALLIYFYLVYENQKSYWMGCGGNVTDEELQYASDEFDEIIKKITILRNYKIFSDTYERRLLEVFQNKDTYFDLFSPHSQIDWKTQILDKIRYMRQELDI